MSDDQHNLVKYVGNADDRSNGAVTFRDGRPDLELGSFGLASEQEVRVLAASGIILQPAAAELESLSDDELKAKAEELGVDLGRATAKETVLEKIVDHLTDAQAPAADESEDSEPEVQTALPPTATGGTASARGTAGPGAGQPGATTTPSAS